MSADRFRQSILWSKEIDCRRLAVVAAKDRGPLLLFRCERMIDTCRRRHHSGPGKLISVILRQSLTNKTALSFRHFKRQMRLVAEKCLDRQHRQDEWQQWNDPERQPNEASGFQDCSS